MALNYSLKFRKLNFYNKSVLEKEGEIVIDRQSFRLKGKGASDQGITIFFGDIKELFVKDDLLSIHTYTKEKYILSDFSHLFDAFLSDFMRVRNDYLAESLFMKKGMLMKEYEGYAEMENRQGVRSSLGKCRLQFYGESLVVLPEMKEAFPIYFGLVKNHEFDEEEYVLSIYLDNGMNVYISQLGTSFEDAQSTMEHLMGQLYEKMLKGFTEFFPQFDASTLLKLVYLFKGGHFVSLKAIKKVHEDLPALIETMVFENNSALQAKADFLRKEGGDENFYLSLSVGKSRESGDMFLRSWFLQAIPEKNMIVVTRTSGRHDSSFHFFRIIVHRGIPSEKVAAKMLEIDQTLLVFSYDFSPVYKSRRELRKSKYRLAMRKLSFLRLLRKSYVGSSRAHDMKQFAKDFSSMQSNCHFHDCALTDAKK